MWTKLIGAVPDTLKRLFGIVDKVVTDKDKANEIKLEIVKLTAGSPVFEIVMAVNFVLLAVLTFMQRTVPVWCLAVFLIWAAGPLLNSLSKETVGKIFEIVEKQKQHEKED